MEPVLFTVTEVAKLLKVNRNVVYELIHNNIITALKLGSLKITKVELDRFLKEYNGKDLTDYSNITPLSF